jgi:DNA (cytosine-5)-methyltransferase 1
MTTAEPITKKSLKSWFQVPKFRSSPVLLNHYTLQPKTNNIKRAVAGEYTQKSFKRLFWDRPSFTACYGNNEVHIHPELHRRLTVREAARIQTFPDYWVFQGGLTTEFKQIGNAVPPFLGKAVVDAVLRHVSFENKNAVSLFSGIGGLDIGAELAGLDVVAAMEWDENCVRGLRLNKEIGKKTKVHSFLQHATIIQADLSKKENTTKAFIEAHHGRKLPKVDFVLGGPPCQAFSSAGSRKGLSDERGQLYLGYLNILKAFNPHTFIFENVIGLKSMENGAVLETIKKDFKRLGYNLSAIHLDAVNFGIPQHRNRIFLIGTYDEKNVLDAIEHDLKAVSMNNRIVADVLKGLPTARLSPRDHGYDEHYAKFSGENPWDLGGAVFSKDQPEMKI